MSLKKYEEYAVAIATRNRAHALKLSIPRILSQSFPPKQLIIVDSSDNHRVTVEAVNEAVGETPIECIIEHTSRGSSFQRNVALPLITCPIVFFPDDDSIWFPGTAQKQLEVYSRDRNNGIVAVCASESSVPPEDFKIGRQAGYSMRRSEWLKQRFATQRARLENFLFPDPAWALGHSYCESFCRPDWFDDEDTIPVEYMTGFRMSFRTNIIKKIRFDETLRNYGLCEDIDASLRAWRYGAVVGARRAKVFHYKSPERRANGWEVGVIHILNKAYVVCKSTTPGSRYRNNIKLFTQYKVFQYKIGSNSEFGKDRLAGARAAIRELPSLLSSTKETVAECYESALANCLGTINGK